MSQEIIHRIPNRYPPGTPVERLDGQDIRALFYAAYAWLERHYETVNRMNVFPVPDGDTGTNMLLTVKRAWEEIEDDPDEHVGHIVGKIAHGALMGARGNSGVILSQVFRGMARRLEQEATIGSQELAESLQEGSKTAYRGVGKPVEGTILTVVRETAEAALAAARLKKDLRFLFEHTLQVAFRALERTPEQLPVLKKAGVVDSGALGFCYLWEGMTRHLRGEIIERTEGELREGEADLSELPDEWGYDIQFLLYADHVSEEHVREQLEALGGESIVVGKIGDVIKVHVHAPDPGPFLSYGASLGELDDIVVENMTLQTLRRKGKFRPAAKIASTASSISSIVPEDPPINLLADEELQNRVAVVAVSPGEGFHRVFQSLGVDRIVNGGQTMNPSTADLLEAVENVPQEEVIILPNNKNVILAAEQAAAMSKKRVHVIPTRTVPQGIAAMLAFDPEGDADQNVEAMKGAMENVRTGSVTVAVNDAEFDHIRVRRGDVIGLADGKLITKGNRIPEVVLDLLKRMKAEEFEIITLYYGDGVKEEEAQNLAQEVQNTFPEQEIEVIYGGQPHYPYIISLE